MWQAGQTVFDGAPEPESNKVMIPDAPGLGFTPKHDALAECRAKTPKDLKAAGMQTNDGKITKV